MTSFDSHEWVMGLAMEMPYRHTEGQTALILSTVCEGCLSLRASEAEVGPPRQPTA